MAYRVAVTTDDGLHINCHFGRASQFYIYEFDDLKEGTEKCTLLEIRNVEEQKDPSASQEEIGGCLGHSESRIAGVAELLKDCSWLLTKKIGPKPYRLLKQRGIESLEAPDELETAMAMLYRYCRPQGTFGKGR